MRKIFISECVPLRDIHSVLSASLKNNFDSKSCPEKMNNNMSSYCLYSQQGEYLKMQQ